MTPQELLNQTGITLNSYATGEYASTCPNCSATRKPGHQKLKCLGIKIDDRGATWHCNHCGWSGPEKGTGQGNGHDRSFAATYDYHDKDGNFSFQKVRNPPGSKNRFFMRRPNGSAGWISNTEGVDTNILYRLPEINEAIALGRTIFVVEGEKDADNLWRIGIAATCNAHGAHDPSKNQRPKWKIEHSEQLRGADIIVIPDHDDPGYAHCEATCRLSLGIAKSVRRLVLAKHWPECREGGDVSDWLAAGHAREQLDALIEQAQDYVEQPADKPTIRWQYHDAKPSPPTPWLIKKLLPRNGAGLISGQWGTFKTTVALDMSVSVMAEPPSQAEPPSPFAGRFAVKRRGGVAYFAPEGAGGLKSRLDAIAKERGVIGALPFAWCAGCPPLMAPDALDQLARMAKEAARYLKQHFGVDLVLIFIDTIIAAAGYAKTGDDNDAAVGQKVMKVLSDLSARTEALVLGIDHFGKIIDTGTRGSSAKEGHADVVLALLGERQPNGTITGTRLALRKLRDGPSGLEIPFTPRDIEIGFDEDEEPETRKVIDWNKATTSAKPDDDAGWSKSLQLLRRILMTLLVDGKDISPFADGPMVRAVDLKLIRAEFYKQYPADGTDEQKTEARRKAFARTIKDAQAKSLIVIREIQGVQLVWFAQREAAI